MITENDIKKALLELPQEQKTQLAIQATLNGIDIEKTLVPTLANMCRGIEKVVEPLLKNYRYLNNK